ncbi:unnamed protein product [Rotaria sp. Silwood1]|nr:unnamed protein product [Rotaria sp. Silwood1]CAF0849701.1 unnamed protein product [Rotaria sp. Silwood1]CAF0960719.1 unnamed protein product [Rotaria sp. Silwood1]CAF3347436.1 unnamed protein product [Rotaria sp. Silwood1]CAF3404019.1 unnamed protein product [Rotaria sp. Silwood1]
MNEIFAHAKSILVVWVDDVDSENLLSFREIIQTKAKRAHIAFENVQMLFESRRATSSFDIILFDLISKTDKPTNIDLINEFFRLLHPNGYLITHIEHIKQTQVVDHFKMCGFSSCDPLDSNSSFLIENKNPDVKRRGSLWLCQKPSFDVGYSVPLRRTGISLIRQVSTTGGGKKTWTVEDDDDDIIDTNDLLDDKDRKKPDVKSYDCGTKSSGDRKACKNCTCGLAQEVEHEEHTKAQENVKSSCGNCYLGDAFRCTGCPARGLPPFKPGERVTLPTVSDV